MTLPATTLPKTLDGYSLIRFLGRGGFGEVWLCRSEAMGDYRALKWIPAANEGRLEREYAALLHYRKAAAALRSPCLIPIEHVGRTDAALYYIMPLADGVSDIDPADPEWTPLSFAAKLQARMASPDWFAPTEMIDLMLPVLEGLQVLTGAGLVHRDVKPDNILFFHGKPCLGDISLLAADASTITRHGTPGYTTPTWYKGGHPDMYGAAATLYTLLTGNPPDRMGRSAFLWPPQGESTLSETGRAEWKRLHAVVRRAAEEQVEERFLDFRAMADAVAAHQPSAAVPKSKPEKGRAVMLVALVAFSAITLGVIQWRKVGRSTHEGQPPQQTAPASPGLTPDQKADYTALAGMVMGYLQDGNYANALASVEELLSTYPQSRTQPGYSVARAMALKGLGRVAEAKEELHKEVNLSPNIPAMDSRKDLWEELGDLEAAEQDLTRILQAFGPATFPLFLRADIRAQRGNFSGVQQDRQAAYQANAGDNEQRELVDKMWTPLETKYPGYGAILQPDGAKPDAPATEQSPDPHDAEILKVCDEITSDITDPGIPLSEAARAARERLATDLRESFVRGDYARCLTLIDRTTDSIPALEETPVVSLFRALVLERLGRREESAMELKRPSHQDKSSRHAAARSLLLEALGMKDQAAEVQSAK